MIPTPDPGFAALRRLVAPHVPEPASIYDRLAQGRGRPCLFLPFLGEFGHLMLTHVRLVHFSRASRKVVCCRPGEQVLFPSADAFVTDWADPVDDAQRMATMRSTAAMWPGLVARHPGHEPVDAGGLYRPHELVVLQPEARIPFRPKRRGLCADVVLGVRHRRFSPERNWPHWRELAAAILSAGLSFAVVGHKATSLDLPGQLCHSGDLDTDAAVELIQNCRLYVGTDTGSSHLAAAVGPRRMLLFREELKSTGRDFVDRMRLLTPGLRLMPPEAWDAPDAVAMLAVSLATP